MAEQKEPRSDPEKSKKPAPVARRETGGSSGHKYGTATEVRPVPPKKEKT
jgi:hypothetical protein